MVNSNEASLRIEKSDDVLYKAIVSRLKDWTNGPLNMIRASTGSELERPAEGLRLLSLGMPVLSHIESMVDQSRWGRSPRSLHPPSVGQTDVRDQAA